MTSSNKKKAMGYITWMLAYLIFPLLISIGVVLLNNDIQEKKQPNLVAKTKEYHVTEISENEFKIECPFEIINNGGSTTKNQKITFSIRNTGQTISEISILEDYKGFYKEENGGCGNSYIVLSVDLPKGRIIKGSIFILSNNIIPKESICPLVINY